MRYLHHGVELDSVSPASGSEAHAAFPSSPGRINGAIVAGTVATPAARPVVKPAPVITIRLQVLKREAKEERGRAREV